MKILILGGGNMGMTYAQSFLRSRLVTADNLLVLCRTYEKANHLSQTHEGRFFSDPRLCVAEADLLILAVKPQDSTRLFGEIRDLVQPGQVYLSIMAGVRMATISQELAVRLCMQHYGPRDRPFRKQERGARPKPACG